MNTEQLVINQIDSTQYINKVFNFKGTYADAEDLAKEKNFGGGVHIGRPIAKFKTEFKKEISVCHDSSHGSTKPEKVTMNYSVWVCPIRQQGGYELYSDCSEYYAEGCLEFDSDELTGYDGMFALDLDIIKQVGKWGFDVKDMKKSMEGE